MEASMNKLSIEKRAQVIGCLVEGMSIRSTVRITGAAKNTVTKLIVELGAACAEYMDGAFRDLPCKRIQCDEIWAFCYAKEKNVPDEHKGELGYGDVYTWTALDPDTKLIPSFMVGKRDAEYGNAFMQDLASRLTNRVQLTTDGHSVYLQAVENAFGCDIDYAMLIKIYGKGTQEDERKYSPVECTGAEMKPISGRPDEKHISTSHVERQNLTMRMSMRRFTRLTNGFSKKIENHFYATAMYFMYYNFGRIHKTLRVTPAMEAGISDHVWTLEEIAELI
jgi:IS1 family transposase